MIVRTFGRKDDTSFYQVITPEYAGKPRSGMGAARQGGRASTVRSHQNQSSSHQAAPITADRPSRLATTFITARLLMRIASSRFVLATPCRRPGMVSLEAGLQESIKRRGAGPHGIRAASAGAVSG